MVMATREGIMRANPDKRPFVLSRANFMGGHRYAAAWTGDNVSDWEHLGYSVPMTLNLGLSGQPFSGPDIGGFAGNATPGLFARWMGVGAFFPFCRGHSSKGTAGHEPWSFGEETERAARTALLRRYRLLPYLYTLFWEASKEGLPVMRPVFFADPSDRRLREEDKAFLLGADVLVLPRLDEKNPSLPLPLPKGDWKTFTLVGEDPSADVNQPELRLRPGAVLPVGKAVESTMENSLDPLTLIVSLDRSGRAEGALYWDGGEGYGYRNGFFSLMTFSAEKTGNEVIVRLKKR